MRIRLPGNPAETAAALAPVARVLRIRTASRPHPDPRPPMFQRIDLDATPREDTHR